MITIKLTLKKDIFKPVKTIRRCVELDFLLARVTSVYMETDSSDLVYSLRTE